jgi:LacI family transcriptional regulator
VKILNISTKLAGALMSCGLLVASLTLAVPAAAQVTQPPAAQLTAADVQRLQEAVYDANTEIARLRSHDAERAKVLQAITQLGFVPNLSAKRLAKGHAMAIALLYKNASWHYIEDVQRGVLDTARSVGYTTLMHPCSLTQTSDACGIIEMASQRQVDGFIMTAPVENATRLLLTLDQMGIPFVRLTPFDRESPWPYVAATDRVGACEMTRYLISLGHRRIGYVFGLAESRAAHDRFAGYREALAESGIEYDESLVRFGDDHFDAGHDATESLLRMTPRPTAVFCSNDEMAAGACVAVHEAGLEIPGDVSVAGFDDIALARQIWPPLTTVRQPIYDIARTATRLLVDLLAHNAIPTPHHEIPTSLVIRASTAGPGKRVT